jgi:hypothetical protein
LLIRGKDLIVVFDKEGNFINIFGKGLFSENRIHGLYVAHDDMFFVADDGIHTI